MIKKVIYIGYQSISRKYYYDYYVDKCIDNGYDVEYWDLSQLYFPKLNGTTSFYFKGTRIIKSFKEIKALLSLIDTESTIFIPNITYRFKVWKLFILLSSHHCKTAFFGRGAFPIQKESDASKMWEIILSFDFERLVSGLKNKLALFLKQKKIIRTYDLIFTAGSEGYITIGGGSYLDNIYGKNININYFDYEKFIDSREGAEPIIKNNYIVFIDQYLADHADFEITNQKGINSKDYFSNLNNFFDLIEKKFKSQIVIAAHPKAIKYKTENPFNGREIIFNKTSELVRDSAFVVTHYSTAISFPILYKKPILLITSLDIKKKLYRAYKLTLLLAKTLNCEVIYFDSNKFNEEFRLVVDEKKYDDFKYKYLTSKASENIKSSDIFLKEISQL